jgi:hypothetical protein
LQFLPLRHTYAEDDDESPSRSALYIAIGAAAGFADQAYAEKGAKIAASREGAFLERR